MSVVTNDALVPLGPPSGRLRRFCFPPAGRQEPITSLHRPVLRQIPPPPPPRLPPAISSVPGRAVSRGAPAAAAAAAAGPGRAANWAPSAAAPQGRAAPRAALPRAWVALSLETGHRSGRHEGGVGCGLLEMGRPEGLWGPGSP